MPKPRLGDTLFRLLRAGFRVLPINEATRDRWRNGFFERFPAIRPSHAPLLIGQAPATRRGLREAGGRAIGHVEASDVPMPDTLPARLVAFYLPQFHPIAENDAAWGAGYTEWTAVSRALPQFEGHAQPRLPADLGFYDLRRVETMRAQAKLAARYGIGAFCFYFYWFHGKTLLEQPLKQWRDDANITLPYCLCWANEPWTRTWDGRTDDVLMAQSHDAEDDLAFIAHVADYLRDPRYLRIDGKPVLLVYRPGKLPDARASAARWRAWCRDNGIGEIHLAYTQSFERPDPREIGFDAAVEFPPNLAAPGDITAEQIALNPDYAGSVLDWRDLPAHYLGKPAAPYPLHPAVNCGWDNEPRRRGRGRTWLHAAPRRYRDWLRQSIAQRTQGASPLVFINAWNEWAEGAVLEPDSRLGHAWLKASRDALLPVVKKSSRPCVVIHAFYPDVLAEMLAAIAEAGIDWRIVISTTADKHDVVRHAVQASGLAAEISVGENRGRDILPFLRIANRLLDEGEDLVLKLHTKRSTHRGDGDVWRREFIDALLAHGNATRIVDAFRAAPQTGLVVPGSHIQPMRYYWGANAANVAYLCRRLGIPPVDIDNDRFAAGSMYWLRLEALRPLLDAHLDEAEFDAEAGQVDGTLAHAIERIVLKCVEAAGYQLQAWPAGNEKGDATSAAPPYRYAKRD